MKTAIVIGATGLIGRALVEQLLGDDRVEEVKVFTRRTTNIVHPALDEQLVDFDKIESWAGQVIGDALFSALGTTRKKARSKAVQRRVDVDYQLGVATAAATNGVGRYLLVSSLGANASSPWFYPRIKGELEEAVQRLKFRTVAIFRPSVLTGKRDHSRPGERLGEFGARAFGALPMLERFRPIAGETVARAMINTALKDLPDDTLWLESNAIVDAATR